MMLDVRRLADELQVAGFLREPVACAFLSGSVAYGWNTSTSDVDIHVVTDGPVPSTVHGERGLRQDRGLDDWMWDLEYQDSELIERLLDCLSWETYLSADPASIISDADVDLVSALWHGVPLLGESTFEEIHTRLELSAAPWVVAGHYLDDYDRFALDVQGLVERGDDASAVMSARAALACVAAAALSVEWQFPVAQKWRARQMRLVDPDCLPFDDYWALETMSGFSASEPAAWAVRTIRRCQRALKRIAFPAQPPTDRSMATIRGSAFSRRPPQTQRDPGHRFAGVGVAELAHRGESAPDSRQAPTQAIGPEFVPAPQLGVRIRNLNGALLLSGSQHILELSESAMYIWSSIDGQRTIQDIAVELTKRSKHSEDSASAMVTALVAELLADAIVFPAEPEAWR